MYIRTNAGPRSLWPPVFCVAPDEYRRGSPDGERIAMRVLGNREDEGDKGDDDAAEEDTCR